MARAPRSYPAPWKGEIVLACRKCQKKLKKHGGLRELATLKKSVKRYNKKDPDRQLHVINVSCMDLCPKAGVTVCCPERNSAKLSILWSNEDIWQLANPNLTPAEMP